MAIYTPITNVMPLASMVTGAPVSAALGDQIRDNLVALYDGWWFKATRATGATLASSIVTAIPMDTISRSTSAVDDGTVVLANGGAITVSKPGIWRLGWYFAFTSPFTGIAEALIDATDAVGAYVAERLTDPNATTTHFCVSGVVNLTSATNTLNPMVYAVGTPSLAAAGALNNAPTFWGYRIGDNP